MKTSVVLLFSCVIGLRMCTGAASCDVHSVAAVLTDVELGCVPLRRQCLSPLAT